MSRTVRLVMFGVAAAVLAPLFGLAIAGAPPFGTASHPYRDLAVAAALRNATANVVSSINFDQRGLDTLVEETILLASVVGATIVLRASTGDVRRELAGDDRALAAVTLVSVAVLPGTLLIGLDVVVHGHLTPGGGFQGGVVLATGLHLLYLASRYETLERLRPLHWYRWSEGLSTAAFGGIGVGGLATGAGFLANVLPHGSFADLLSGGTVPLLNIAVGVAVAGGVVVLLAQFLDQALRIASERDGKG
ncbi:MnhB domain-containing protein [Rhizomonospora bruguierae]|uniref:MnhB domain-containing protein n=1 Tax=Rhizomonospora bruguierae TaxID=1581705 RepID=UPI001BCC369D|nr:MnhB domain-containing protein [Micromonospora sp. NBRC 107566]